MHTLGISPKVIASVVTAIVGYLATHYGFSLDPNTAVAITLGLLTAAGVIAGPGKVIKPPSHADLDKLDAELRV
jgi:hypothetical protein